MSQRRPPLPVIIILLLAIAGGAYYFFFYKPGVTAAATGALSASGTVETTSVSIAPELAGKVTAVNVDEGASVKAGDVLITLDQTMLAAQRAVAEAGLETAKSAATTTGLAAAAAQAQYDITLNAALQLDKTKRSKSWFQGQSSNTNLPEWYYTQNEQIDAAQVEIDAATAALADFQKKQASVEANTSGADFVKAEQDLLNAQAAFQVADDLHNRATTGKDISELSRIQLIKIARGAQINVNALQQDLVDAAQKIYDNAQTALTDAQNAYNDAVSTDGAKDVLKARAQTSMAQERYYTALDFKRQLETGVNSQSVTASRRVLDQAQSVADQANTAVKQAQANLDLIDTQMAKLSITAPSDGVILTRNIEPGEVVNPGSVLLSLGRLDQLTITVYVPEDRVGEVSLGQSATVTVDSFPGQTFNATVSFIATQAEFTPRNVQTVDGRKNTVFAIKLKLDNTSGSLKPGMPADVVFGK